MSVGEPVGMWPPAVRAAQPIAAHPVEVASEPEPDTGPIVTVTVTCVSDGHSHAVPDTELSALTSGSGFYRAVCGHVVTAAPMVAPEGMPCRQCDEAREVKAARPSRRLGLRLLGG